MADRVLESTIKQALASEFTDDHLEFLWHAGEPLLAGRAFYQRAVDLQLRHNIRGTKITNTIQTNATLIDDDWCRLLKDHEFCVGVSLDGPEGLNDQQRVAWNGRGTFKKVMKGIERLRHHDIRFGVLCVLTAESLSDPDALYEFICQEGFRWIGFNIEENEGAHTFSSINATVHRRAYEAFFSRLYDRWTADGRQFGIREFDDLHKIILDLRANGENGRTPDETIPFAIITVARDGFFSTFSPELIGTSSQKYGNFFIGHVERERFDAELVRRRPDLFSDVMSGIQNCRRECPYFALCGGAYLSNRIVEYDDFAATETNACRLHRQVLSELVLDRMLRISRALFPPTLNRDHEESFAASVAREPIVKGGEYGP